ncbi:hypothetical protein RE6C_00445 [Rhodopirellula europaea 6C]|uniref:Uncharacterized protein n=1 Tax=Rhodopirellula europaea 6C TaxID=1263867 RepID=M2B1L7_9BACT|nr:hypothetical protein RE6C_00445 [Rhodopirellula europaea 6C]
MIQVYQAARFSPIHDCQFAMSILQFAITPSATSHLAITPIRPGRGRRP